MMGGEGAVASSRDGTFELKVYHSPVKLHASVRSPDWAQSSVRVKGRDVTRRLSFESGQVIEGVEITLRRTTSRVTGTVSGVSRDAEDHEGTVLLFRRDDGDDVPAMTWWIWSLSATDDSQPGFCRLANIRWSQSVRLIERSTRDARSSRRCAVAPPKSH